MEASPPGGNLVSCVADRSRLSGRDIDEMWKLYSTYYAGTSRALFESDLARKQHVLLCHDTEGLIRGFTTAEITRHPFAGGEANVLFSGDTIVDEPYWGKNDFAFSWIRFTATIIERDPDTPLFWLLIVKGHRTYRYLNVFARRYYPAPDWETPRSMQDFLDQLATARFGQAYKPEQGVIRFDESHGHLKPEWAEPPASALQRKEVAFFLERNPGFRQGDELVCLCQISEENMKPLTRRVYLAGASTGQPSPVPHA